MRFLVPVFASFLCAMSLTQGACGADFQTTDQSVDPATVITWLGQQTQLQGAPGLKVGTKLPEVTLINAKMEPTPLGSVGTVKIIDVLPSIDTPVCDRQTHLLSESKALNPAVERLTVSMDLPYAQRRFAEQAKINNVIFYSDYRDGQFAQATGLKIERNGLLARAVIVVGKDGVVRHIQIVPEITQMPEIDKASEVANQLAR